MYILQLMLVYMPILKAGTIHLPRACTNSSLATVNVLLSKMRRIYPRQAWAMATVVLG